jgi:hypothetical protein
VEERQNTMTIPKTFGMTLRWLGLLVAIASTPAAADGYHVIKRIAISGDFGWDYVTADTEGRRLYVSHRTEVVVLDLNSGTVVGTIGALRDVHGVAVAREFGHGFISATDPGSVTMFDLTTLGCARQSQGRRRPQWDYLRPKDQACVQR